MLLEQLQSEMPQSKHTWRWACASTFLLLPPHETKKTDANEAAIEYADGEAVAVYPPYRKGWLGMLQSSAS